MNKNLRLFFAVLLFFPIHLLGQMWPYNIPNLPRCNTMPPNTPTSCTKTAVVNNGDWEDAATWSPTGVPSIDAIVCIPSGITVRVNTPTYTPASVPCGTTYTNTIATPRLAIFVCGIIDFKAGGKLNLGCGSVIQVWGPNGRILAANGNSDQIQIGGTVVWGGVNNNINGPAIVTGGGVQNGTLAVTLNELTAELKTPFEVVVKWSTGSEINSKEFIVEKSADGKNWTALKTVDAKGNSNSISQYSITDRLPFIGVNYYRLKQVDFNGAVEYSSITSITNRTRGKIVVFPNPATSQATLYSSDIISRSQTIQVFNMNGSFVQNLPFNGGNVLQFNTTHLSPGLYLIRISENGKTVTETKLIKQ